MPPLGLARSAASPAAALPAASREIHAGPVTERGLRGGAINLVTLAGDTVRRPPSPRSEFVRRLLDLLAGHRWPGAPRFLGVDDLVREVLSYLPGHAAWEPDQPRSCGGRTLCWRGIEAGPDRGEPAMLRLREDGTVAAGPGSLPVDAASRRPGDRRPALRTAYRRVVLQFCLDCLDRTGGRRCNGRFRMRSSGSANSSG